MSLALQIALLDWSPVRAAVAFSLLCRGSILQARGRRYAALNDFCRVVRLSNPGIVRRAAERRVQDVIRALVQTQSNSLVRDFLDDPASRTLAAAYAQSGQGPSDLFRDVLVLKSFREGEKGVILLKYARTFSAIVALLDLSKLQERYHFVLEPCWSGYCDPSILMHIVRDQPLIVMCFTEDDYRYIESVGAPLVPIRLGPADWVNPDIFSPSESGAKPYDLVMVANWGVHKRHAQLFRALQDVRDRDIRVLLCGFAWANRTADDIRREAAQYANPRVTIEIREKVPQTELAGLVGQSKVFVFLTRKEGDNKALVEAMFADVPSIVYDQTIGGAGSRVNPSTGMFASDAQLGSTIAHMLDHYREFAPRAWALGHTGSRIATQTLEEALRRAVTASGGNYTTGIVEKTNAPNLAYKDPARRADFAADYKYIRGCQRASSRS